MDYALFLDMAESIAVIFATFFSTSLALKEIKALMFPSTRVFSFSALIY